MSPRKSTEGKGIRKGVHLDAPVRGMAVEQAIGVSAARVAAALIARFGKQICEKAVCLRTSVPTVSYTHLDVYKRQGGDSRGASSAVRAGNTSR